MALSVQQLSNSSLTYTPPQHTAASFRFTLRSDMFWQDGTKVTAFDVAFSYLSLKAVGNLQSLGADPMTGVTILGPSQFDINVNQVGPFTLAYLTALTILPGVYWSNSLASPWNKGVSTCTATSGLLVLSSHKVLFPQSTVPLVHAASSRGATSPQV